LPQQHLFFGSASVKLFYAGGKVPSPGSTLTDDGVQAKITQFVKHRLSHLTTLAYTGPTLLHLRDGDVALLKRVFARN
jgi:hypothetical protein